MSENDNEVRGMECNVCAMRDDPDSFLVEAIDWPSDGEIYRAIFQGPGARVRALAYAASTYGHNGILMETPVPKYERAMKPKPKLSVVPADNA